MARYTTEFAGQKRLLELGNLDVGSALAKNEELHPLIWDQLYQTGAYYPEHKAFLLKNAPTTEQAALLLNEKNKTAKLEALQMGVPKLSEVSKCALYNSPAFDSEHAASVLISTQFLPDFTEKLLSLTVDSKLHSQNYILYLPAIEAIATKLNLLKEDELLQLLIDRPIDSYHLSRVLDYHPTLLPPLLDLVEQDPITNDWALIPLARSRHLTDPQSVRLLALTLKRDQSGSWSQDWVGGASDDYPVVIRSIANHPSANIPARLAAARWALNNLHDRNIVGATHRDYVNLPKIIEELTFAPELSQLHTSWSTPPASHHGVIQRALKTFGVHLYPTLTTPLLSDVATPQPQHHFSKDFIDSTLLPTLKLNGPTAWDIFISLTPGWTGSEQELLEVTTSTLLR